MQETVVHNHQTCNDNDGQSTARHKDHDWPTSTLRFGHFEVPYTLEVLRIAYGRYDQRMCAESKVIESSSGFGCKRVPNSVLRPYCWREQEDCNRDGVTDETKHIQQWVVYRCSNGGSTVPIRNGLWIE